MTSLVLQSRPSTPNDLNFVYDTWLNSWRTSRAAGTVPNHLYYDVQRATIANILGRGGQVRVAHFANTPDLIQGWVCFELKEDVTILHYLYSRDPYMLPALTAHFLDTTLGQTGLYTHQQFNKGLKTWKHCPEIARRKSL